MSSLNVYKCKKEYVSKKIELPAEVETFLEYHTNDYGNAYVDSEEDLKELFGEDEEEQFNIVNKWFKDNNLFEMDITIEE